MANLRQSENSYAKIFLEYSQTVLFRVMHNPTRNSLLAHNVTQLHAACLYLQYMQHCSGNYCRVQTESRRIKSCIRLEYFRENFSMFLLQREIKSEV